MSGTTTFNYTDSIVQYTVPTTGLYDVVAVGASGAPSADSPPDGTGGLGAVVSGDVLLTAGEVLEIAVGGTATSGISGGGGGGGSFVVERAASSLTPLVIAGGDGGGTQEVS